MVGTIGGSNGMKSLKKVTNTYTEYANPPVDRSNRLGRRS